MFKSATDFDWSCTNRDLVFYVPNFKRKHLLIPTLKRFKTSVPEDKWMFLIVNDGPHEPMEDLERDFNLRYFTFERDPADERNGCMIRNFVIKRCQSEWLATKDPEIIIEGDMISKILGLNDVVYRPRGMVELNECDTQRIIDNPFIDLTKLPILRQWEASDKRNQAFHAGCCIRTQKLKDMGGYNEKYRAGYGYEDWQMLERLKKSGAPVLIDKETTTYHIGHPIMRRFHKTILDNESTYKQDLQRLDVVANGGCEWGRGI
jgi:hypothetical protein